jgi:tRNA nucleotidyltransferase (CCA-adding enzyme)
MIRCIGDPSERFGEDALRILRAVRFASELGFRIEPQTSEAMFRLKDTLLLISAERIRSETDRFLAGPGCPDLLPAYADLFRVFLPEPDVMTEESLAIMPRTPDDAAVRLAVLLLRSKDPASVMTRMKYAKREIRTVENLLSLEKMPVSDETCLRRILNRLTTEFSRYLDFVCAVHPSYDRKRIEEMYAEIMRRHDCFLIRDLKISGNDLVALGYRGKEISETMQECLDLVIEKKLPNRTEDLKEYLQKKRMAV